MLKTKPEIFVFKYVILSENKRNNYILWLSHSFQILFLFFFLGLTDIHSCTVLQ